MNKLHGWIALMAAAAITSASYAQDSRLQHGDVLDASPLAGSGGRNTSTRLQERGELLKSHLYVTGRVTGLGAFRGGLPYTPGNQFHLNLPSAGISGFNRRSVGLQDVLGGPTYKTTPYFSPSTTALGAGGILSGRAATGTNVPRTTSLAPSLTRKLRVSALADYRFLAPPGAGRVLSAPVQQWPGAMPARGEERDLLRGAGAIGPRAGPGRAADKDAFAADAAIPAWFLTRAGAVALFGALQADSRDRLARELHRIGRAREPIEGRLDARVDRSLDSQYRLGGEQTLPPELFPTDPNWRFDPARKAAPRGAAGRWGAPRRNEDVYVDLLLRLRERRDREAAAKAPKAPPPDVVATAPKTPFKIPSVLFRNIVEIDAERRVVVHRLGGLGKDDVNRYMAVAENKLKQGKYYEAVEHFRLVIIFDSENPLPLIGMGLAYFGAGEAYSAGLQFRKAIEMLPPLIESRIDIAKMMDMKDAKARLVSLEQRFRRHPYRRRDPHVYFAACYVSRNVGDHSEAVRYAEIIQKLAPENKIIRAYAQLVLTGKLPTTQPSGPRDAKAPTTQPPASPAGRAPTTQPAAPVKKD